jgi:hypothetical protein
MLNAECTMRIAAFKKEKGTWRYARDPLA